MFRRYDFIIDEEFKSLLPEPTKDELELLEKSILEEGCRDAIIIWHGYVIDGIHRYQICKKHGIEPKIMQKSFANKEEVKTWIIRNQLARRNLPDHEKVRLTELMLKTEIGKEAKEKQREGGKKKGLMNSSKASIHTRKEIAKKAGVSEDTVRKVEAIEKDAPEEVKQAARKGNISVNKAYKTVSKKENKQKEKALDKPKPPTQDKVLMELKKWWQEANGETKVNFVNWAKERRNKP